MVLRRIAAAAILALTAVACGSDRLTGSNLLDF
jgi:hypothetical protein